jgi:hypothetical protein
VLKLRELYQNKNEKEEINISLHGWILKLDIQDLCGGRKREW